jgi:beta-fructofuranosidase
LIQWPIEEVEKLRDKQINITGEKLEGGSTLEITGINASQVSKLLCCNIFLNIY